MVRLVSAILLGVLYQFYYGGGDTFMYHTHGSRILAEAIFENPSVGIPLFFADNPGIDGSYEYYSRIQFFGVPKTFLMLRFGALFDLLTFGTYSATALLFAVFSFTGLWMLFDVLAKIYPHLTRPLAWTILFVPTVVFWGSGILRDTLTIGALGFVFAALIHIVHFRRINIFYIVILISGLIIIYTTKVYFLICLIPSILILLFYSSFYRIRSIAVRSILFVPFVVLFVPLSIFVVERSVEDSPGYSLDNIAETARITAYDIGFYTGKSAGSTYSLGELDGTFQSLLRLAPDAIVVSLFRPFIWEVNNPLMLLSAIESLLFLLLTIYFIIKSRFGIFRSLIRNPITLSFLVFSLGFAFAVGVSTFNFGTLSRYRIPVLGFYLTSMLIAYYSERSAQFTLTSDEQN